MADIFVSYSHNDGLKVTRLVRALESQGWSVWWDRDLIPGSLWDPTITKELRSAKCVIVAWSEASATSAMVKEEAALALAHDKLVPVSLDQTGPPPQFGNIEVLDLSRWLGSTDDPNFTLLARAVERLLSDEAIQTKSPINIKKNRSAIKIWGVTIGGTFYGIASGVLAKPFVGAAFATAIAIVGTSAYFVVPKILTKPIVGEDGHFSSSERERRDDPVENCVGSQHRPAALTFARIYYNCGNAYYSREDYQHAMLSYTEAIRTDLGFAEAYAGRGASHYKLDQLDRAIDDCHEALRLDPKSTLVLGYCAPEYLAKGEYPYGDSLAVTWAQSGDIGRPDLSVPYQKTGDVRMARRDLAGALKSYRDDLTIAERLAQSDPGNVGWQHDLSVSYDRVGNALVAEHDLAGALKSYRDSLAVRERLAQSDPGNVGWQHDLSVSYSKVGDLLVAQGDLAGALKSYRDSLTIRERLAQSNPRNADWLRDLSVLYRKIGDTQKAQGDLDEDAQKAGSDLEDALKSYARYLMTISQLIQTDPGSAGSQRDLRDVAVSHSKLADVYRRLSRFAEALAELRAGQAIMDHLAKLSPNSTAWERDIGWFNDQIAALTNVPEHEGSGGSRNPNCEQNLRC